MQALPLVFVAMGDDLPRHLVAAGLTRDGYDVTPVATMAGLLERMTVELSLARRCGRDFVVLADARFPSFSAVDLLELLRNAGQRAPVILVGDLREEDTPRALDAILLPGRINVADVRAAVEQAVAAAQLPDGRDRLPPRPALRGDLPLLPLPAARTVRG
jgi:DNA-binding response OmpR family regulator